MTNRKVFNLTLIRHGQTVANVQKIIQGSLDTQLTTLGIEQAELLGKFFSTLSNCDQFNRVFSSDQGRALETCNIVTANIDIQADSIRKDRRLRERKYGRYEGRPIHEFQQEAYDHGFNESNFTHYTPDGVESMNQVITRVRDFLRSLCHECRESDEVLVVSHWATIKEFLKIFQPLSGGSITKNHLVESPNAAFSKFKIECNSLSSQTIGDGFIASVQVVCLHQTPHLMDVQTSVNIGHSLD